MNVKEVKVDDCLLNISAKELEDGSFHVEIATKGKVVETNLGTDEDVAKAKFMTLADGLQQAVETVVNGLLDAYGSAEDKEVEDER